MLDIPERPEPAIPTEQDAELAKEASRTLASSKEEQLRVHLDGKLLVLPAAAKRLLQHLLTEMSYGHAVTVIPLHAELTTQEAADFLNVSRPYLVKLLESGKLPYHKVGTHRRVKFSDLRKFQQEAEQRRREAMDEIAAQAQKLELGY
jgi:excisionase family DNA binding protein